MKKVKINEKAVKNSIKNAKKNAKKACDKVSGAVDNLNKYIEQNNPNYGKKRYYKSRPKTKKVEEKVQESIEPKFDSDVTGPPTFYV